MEAVTRYGVVVATESKRPRNRLAEHRCSRNPSMLALICPVRIR
jgi:hypothetical protein